MLGGPWYLGEREGGGGGGEREGGGGGGEREGECHTFAYALLPGHATCTCWMSTCHMLDELVRI